MRYCPISNFLDLVCIASEFGDFQKLYGNTKKKWTPTNNVVTCQRQCRDVWLIEEKVKERPNVATLRRRDVPAISASEL